MRRVSHLLSSQTGWAGGQAESVQQEQWLSLGRPRSCRENARLSVELCPLMPQTEGQTSKGKLFL